MGEVAWVSKVDGRTIGSGTRGPLTAQLSGLFGDLVASSGERVVD